MTVTAFHSWWVDAYKRHGLLLSLYDDRLLVETQFLKGSIGHYYPVIECDSEFVNKIKDRVTNNTIDVPKSFSEMRLEEFPNKYVITRNWGRERMLSSAIAWATQLSRCSLGSLRIDTLRCAINC